MPLDLSFVQVDAFAERPFQGNPAVVCRPGDPLEPSIMQRIALEMNVSETSFLVPDGDDFRLRWFTPKVEVNLCGHATLAAAHALWNEWGHSGETIRFDTLSGPLSATLRDDMIWLDFPVEAAQGITMPESLEAALQRKVIAVSRNRLDYLVELESEEAVRLIQPDLGAIKALGGRGLIVSARAEHTDGADFVSRFFAPAAGIDEDPVTGSAHCALGPYWAARLGSSHLVGYQASGRGGYVHVFVRGERVGIGGKAITVARGTLSV